MRKSNVFRWLTAGVATVVLAGVPATQMLIAADRPATAPSAESIDWNKARSLHQKEQKGEKLTDEEQAYLEKAKAAMSRGEGPGAGQRGQANFSREDMQRARALKQKMDSGEKLTDEEQAFLNKVRAAMTGQRGGPAKGGERPNAKPQGPAPTARESTGMVPLPQLGSEKYKGFEGGLYGNGKNEPPAAHVKAAQEAAGRIKPLDADGKPVADGKIVFLSIGMSNTTQEFSRFKQIADADAAKATNVVVVDGAQGGKAADDWVDAKMPTFDEAGRRLSAQHVSAQQVQAIWIKQAEKMPARLGDFPAHAKTLQSDIEKILRATKERYPNLQIAYLSNRIYAGFASTQLNPEPYAYECAFADRWVIEKQMSGDPTLNCDPAKGDVKSPIVLWGPYLWADGVKGRQGDDVVHTREDLGPDGTHPSEKGRQKVAEQLLKFLKCDPTAKGWFVKK